MKKDKVKELSYYLFFGLMVFAKGIGLDSGNKLYYLLSAVACIGVGCKLVLTKYNIRQIGAMALLCLIAFASYRNSGRMGLALTVLAIIAIKDMDIRKLFRMGLVIYGCSFAFTVVAAEFGMINNPLDVHVKGGTELIRWGMGYSTGNIFHVSYFILVVFLCYTWGKRYDVKHMAGLMAGNLLVFLFSLSYTGGIVTTFYLLLNLYAVKRGILSRAERIVCQMPLPLCLIFSFAGPFLLDYLAVQKLNAMMQARLTFSFYFLNNQPITLFGARMKDAPNFWIIMDNGYVYIFMTFGIVAFALFCAGYAALIARYSGMVKGDGTTGKRGMAGRDGSAGKDSIVGRDGMTGRSGRSEGFRGKGQGERLPELAIIFSFLLYGIMEQFIANAFMNLSLLFMGEVLFGSCSAGDGEEEKEKRIYLETSLRQWICCIGIGVAIAAIYLAIMPVKQYIRVPLDSLLYVDAWSAEIQTVNEENTKEGLKGKMKDCQFLIEQPETMQKAICDAGLEGKLSVEKAVAAMEYSLPISVQSSPKCDMFRFRLLELYCDITEEEYGRLMAQLIKLVEQSQDGIYAAGDDSIYQERVGKSFGEDRIEHMSREKEYIVEKNGSMVRLEHFRTGIFCGLAGMAAALLASGLGSMYGDKRKSNFKFLK